MKKACILCLGIILLSVSCKNSEEKEPAIAETDIAKETTIHCYMKVLNQDTFHLRLNKTGQNITGDLEYDFFEKDMNTGMFKGEMNGDTLIAEYTFKSEGVESVREIAFLIKEVDIQEGFGEMEKKNGKMVFKNKGALSFSDTVLYRNIPCPAQ